jgi:predicted nucleotidyltransferase
MKKQISTKDDVLAVIEDNEDRIKAHGGRKLGLFGSFVKQEQDPGSDIDFLVEFEKDKKTFDNFINLSFLLEDALARRVELVSPESLSPYLSRYILDEVEYVSFSS